MEKENKEESALALLGIIAIIILCCGAYKLGYSNANDVCKKYFWRAVYSAWQCYSVEDVTPKI